MPLQIFGTTTCRVCYNSLVSNVQKDAVVLENIQRRATRMVNCLKHLPYNERLKKLGIPSLEYRRLRAGVIEVYKIVNQIDRMPIDKFFTINDEISTRSNGLKQFKNGQD